MATLRVSREEAKRIIDEAYTDGVQLVKQGGAAQVQSKYEDWERERKQWTDLTKEALRYIYEGDAEANEFETAARLQVRFAQTTSQRLESQRQHLQSGVDKLESLATRLRFAHEPTEQPPTERSATSNTATDAKGAAGVPVVFLVHGHDLEMRETVARFLERRGPKDIEVVILEEQPNKGRTVLEKLEDHAAGSKYAVVLLTPDDEGGKLGGKHCPRARQNVIFEFGWFCGLIGRENVAALYKPDVELPSDLDGLVYVPLDGEWRVKLARELTASGLTYTA